MSNTSRIVLVGHCGFDSASIQRAASHAAPNATVTRVNDQSSLGKAATPDALLLINRVLDGSFSADDGIALIEQLAQSHPDAAPRMMLISNYEDAQRDAVAAGALQGFGKADLGDDTATDRIRNALSSQAKQVTDAPE